MDIHTLAIFALVVGGIIGETMLFLTWCDMETHLAKQEKTTARYLEEIESINHVN